MAKKSDVRLHSEAALAGVGISIHSPSTVFVDRSKSGHRVKFSFRTANVPQLRSIQAVVATLNPGKCVRVWNQPTHHHFGYPGLCVKIYK